MITYLHDTCSRIAPSILKENDQHLHQSCDPSFPFETLIDQVEDAVDFASVGKSPHAAKQIVTASNNLIRETGACDSHYKDWRSLLSIDQNWDTFKRFFSKANCGRCESQFLTETQVTVIEHQVNVANAELDQNLDHESSALETIANFAVSSSEGK